MSHDAPRTPLRPIAARDGSADRSALPLYRRFPALQRLPRAELGSFPSPVERLQLEALRGELWIKRDDLNAPAYGGNKVRPLEFLLGSVRPGDVVLTIGGTGSTHILATAAHARRLGARTRAIRFPHEMNPMAERVAERTVALGTDVRRASWIGSAFLRCWLARGLGGGVHWVPLGGTSPLGVLGHVNAALELSDQIQRGELPHPARVVVPLGTAGTAAGLALGFAIAGVATTVVAARVSPRIATNRARVLRVARHARRFIERITQERLPHVSRNAIQVWHSAYAGAYGRPHPAGSAAALLLAERTGIVVDDTYAAKALAASLALARREPNVTLFWLTFDARWSGTQVDEQRIVDE
jgi:1-aminocyclopropane-1-carboxylate deaminase/D-cysteine desulfhydrase-like pyridoxal-dependent ACC family enzyme